ncbi:MAG: ATP-binding protein [Nitratireductor sp.]
MRLLDLFEAPPEQASLKGNKYTVSCPKNLSIRGRPNALARMVGNLVTNAFRHANKVKVTAIDDRQDVVLWVDDNGSGIPVKDREEVFRPFLRLDEARTRMKAAPALACPSPATSARLHGGDIKLEDSPLGGLRATIRLPH